MDEQLRRLQNAVHGELSRYVNGGGISRVALLQSLLVPRLPFRLRATSLAQRCAELNESTPHSDASATRIEVPVYDGKNLCVRRMMRKLQALQESLYGAYLHGSLASMDDIRYSDFDALVIVKEEVCADPERLARTAYALNGLRKIMFAYDPLQHHGWFVLTTADLRCYCDAYFPLELFRHARSLLPGTGTVVSARPRDSRREYEETLNRALNNIERKLANSGFPKDAFALKSLLSEIMLLPALFIQATRGQAIYKADSFQAAARYFEPSIWQAMDRVSAIRAAWQYQLGGLRRALLTGPVAPRKLITRWCSPPVAPQIRKQLDRQLADLLLRLVSEMRAAARG